MKIYKKLRTILKDKDDQTTELATDWVAKNKSKLMEDMTKRARKGFEFVRVQLPRTFTPKIVNEICSIFAADPDFESIHFNPVVKGAMKYIDVDWYKPGSKKIPKKKVV